MCIPPSLSLSLSLSLCVRWEDTHHLCWSVSQRRKSHGSCEPCPCLRGKGALGSACVHYFKSKGWVSRNALYYDFIGAESQWVGACAETDTCWCAFCIIILACLFQQHVFITCSIAKTCFFNVTVGCQYWHRSERRSELKRPGEALRVVLRSSRSGGWSQRPDVTSPVST